MIELALEKFSSYAWGTPLLVLLTGGGIFFMAFSRLTPFRYFIHAVRVLMGHYDESQAKGELAHYKTLAGSLASTVGMGNISGVAIAIAMGGPGVLFWMWVSAFVGMATKFYTCTLAVMYRQEMPDGSVHAGPMYTIVNGLGERFRPLGIFFCVAAMFGCLPIFQANQLTQIVRETLLPSFEATQGAEPFVVSLTIGLLLTVLVSAVIFGGLKRIAQVASFMVPIMVLLYIGIVVLIILMNIEKVPAYFMLILEDAFTGKAVMGGAVGAVIVAGIRRAAFSNEAGIGTAPMFHGAARTDEPVREGLVAMLGPAVDTLAVCTMTALAILMTDVWQQSDANGIALTALAFETAFPGVGKWLLFISVLFFAASSLFTYSFYGTRCLSFVMRKETGNLYNYFYAPTIIIGAVSSISAVVNLIDGMFAMMAIPTMISALLLAPKVNQAAKKYFSSGNY